MKAVFKWLGIALVLIPAGAWAHEGDELTGVHHMFGMGSYMGIGWVGMLVFWAIILAAIVLVVKALTDQNKSQGGGRRSALGVLQERYAKGEIDKKEFEEKKKDILK